MAERIDEYFAAVEAVLFAAGDPVGSETLAGVIGVTPEEAAQITEALAKKYIEEGRGLRIIRLEDSYQMSTSPETSEYVTAFLMKPKKTALTAVQLETLSIIAYKQPVTRSEIENIRGVSCSHAINKLLDLDLITEAGRLDAPGRPILFATTDEFLRTFGLSSATELPAVSPEQMEDFRQQAEEEYPDAAAAVIAEEIPGEEGEFAQEAAEDPAENREASGEAEV
ncbi:MAG: SMC-Scp complex subunit ScpB [Lachnospiraceae bacterium]|nr:SMC-Scp complex subunit ScpB [Lachnospiraceae bacterium]